MDKIVNGEILKNFCVRSALSRRAGTGANDLT